MEDLPKDIISEILSRVTPDSVLTCKLVCKAWKALLCNIKVGLLFLVPSEKEVGLYYGDYDELIGDSSSFKTIVKKMSHLPIERGDPSDCDLVGSCNGLVCLSLALPCRDFGDPRYICNPFKREYVYLPKDDHKQVSNITCGFGYLGTLNEYKVVRIYYSTVYPISKGFVQIYTLGDSNNGWREIGEIKHTLDPLPGVLADETLYFLDAYKKNVLALDLASEEFRLLPTPPCLINECHDVNTFYHLKVMRGCLCIVRQKRRENVDIWSFKNNCSSLIEKKKNCDSCMSWSLDYSMPWIGQTSQYCEPIAFTKSNKLLVWYNIDTLCCYNPQTRDLTRIVKYGAIFDTVPHINTTISLKSLGIEECDPSKSESAQGKLELPIRTMYDNYRLEF